MKSGNLVEITSNNGKVIAGWWDSFQYNGEQPVIFNPETFEPQKLKDARVRSGTIGLFVESFYDKSRGTITEIIVDNRRLYVLNLNVKEIFV